MILSYIRLVHSSRAERHAKGFSSWGQLGSHGYLPDFVLIADGRRHDVAVTRNFTLPVGSIIAVDRGYCDFELFARWNRSGVFFVTRLKDNAVGTSPNALKIQMFFAMLVYINTY